MQPASLLSVLHPSIKAQWTPVSRLLLKFSCIKSRSLLFQTLLSFPFNLMCHFLRARCLKHCQSELNLRAMSYLHEVLWKVCETPDTETKLVISPCSAPPSPCHIPVCPAHSLCWEGIYQLGRGVTVCYVELWVSSICLRKVECW